MPVVPTTPPSTWSRLSALVAGLAAVLLTAATGVFGWVHGTDQAAAAAAQRARHVADAHAAQLDAERARTALAQAVCSAAAQRAATTHRQLRVVRAELLELRRAALLALDTATGLPTATVACDASAEVP